MSVATTSHRSGMPFWARIITGAVVTSSSSITRGFVRAKYARAFVDRLVRRFSVRLSTATSIAPQSVAFGHATSWASATNKSRRSVPGPILIRLAGSTRPATPPMRRVPHPDARHRSGGHRDGFRPPAHRRPRPRRRSPEGVCQGVGTSSCRFPILDMATQQSVFPACLSCGEASSRQAGAHIRWFSRGLPCCRWQHRARRTNLLRLQLQKGLIPRGIIPMDSH
jgi:hypothetical protein